MFESHLGLRENPFVAGHQPRFVYPSREHQEALAHLRFGIENREPFVLITGEVGTGKTTAIYDALHGWGTRAVVALITNSALTRAELLEEIALRFGLALPPGMSKPQAMVLLERHLQGICGRGEIAVLLLDEAQNLERDLLEEIRLLSNLEAAGQKLLQIFLVGQPELEQKLAGTELRQLRQRITVHYRINPLSLEETEHYIHHRVAVAGGNAHDLFPHETCISIYTLTHGIPREINTVCGQALINAYVDDSRAVKVEHVLALTRDTTFRSVLDKPASPGGPPAVDQLLAAEAATVGPRPVTPPAPMPPAPEEPVAAPEPVMPSPVASVPVVEPAHPVIEPPAQPTWTRPPLLAPEPEPELEPEPDLEPEAELGFEAEPVTAFVPEPEPAVEPEPEPEPAEEPVLASDTVPEDETILPPTIAMPAWLDEVIARKQAPAAEPVARRPEVVSAKLPAPILSPAPLPTPLRSAPPSSAPHRVPTGLEPDFISSRLREKLDETESRKRGSAATPWFIAAVVLALVAVGMILMVRFGSEMPWARKTTAKSASTRSAPRTSVVPPAPTSDTSSVASPATNTVAQSASQTNATHAEPLAAASAPAIAAPLPAPKAVAAKPTAPKHTYGIVVGTYFDEARAAEVAQKAAGPMGMPTRTVAVVEDGAPMYRAVVGRFEDRALAELAASRLAEKGGVGEARVIVLGNASKK